MTPLALPGFGLRLGFDLTLPIGDRNVFANERSFVLMPNATFGFRYGVLRLNAELGARLRQALDFAGFRLGNQGFVALGAAGRTTPARLAFDQRRGVRASSARRQSRQRGEPPGR